MVLTDNAIKYSWNQLIKRACLPSDFKAHLIYGLNKTEISDGLMINIYRSGDSEWTKLLNLPNGSLKWADYEELIPDKNSMLPNNKIPILFVENQDLPAKNLIEYHHSKNRLDIHFDLISACFFMLSRWEETVIREYDQHGRFPVFTSTAYKQGFLDQPIIDVYAVILRNWIKHLFPRLQLKQPSFRVQISHDIDHLDPYAQPITNILKMLKNYALHWDREIFLDDFRHIRAGHGITPNIWSVAQLINWSQEFNYQPVFYFMAANRSLYEEGYNLADSRFRKVIRSISASGCEIGLHAGYETMLDFNKLCSEKDRLERTIEKTITHVRQHYLRLKTPHTWNLWHKAGFKYDSSLGYPDVTGFRCGTCHPFKLYDISRDIELDVIEEPLIVMDGAIMELYVDDFKKAAEKIQSIALKCRSVDGIFSLLIHNSSLIHTRYHWRQFFYKTLSELF